PETRSPFVIAQRGACLRGAHGKARPLLSGSPIRRCSVLSDPSVQAKPTRDERSPRASATARRHSAATPMDEAHIRGEPRLAGAYFEIAGSCDVVPAFRRETGSSDEFRAGFADHDLLPRLRRGAGAIRRYEGGFGRLRAHAGPVARDALGFPSHL